MCHNEVLRRIPMFCARCGNSLEPSARFCAASAPPTSPPAAPPPPPPLPPPVPLITEALGFGTPAHPKASDLFSAHPLTCHPERSGVEGPVVSFLRSAQFKVSLKF